MSTALGIVMRLKPKVLPRLNCAYVFRSMAPGFLGGQHSSADLMRMCDHSRSSKSKLTSLILQHSHSLSVHPVRVYDGAVVFCDRQQQLTRVPPQRLEVVVVILKTTLTDRAWA